MEKGGYEKKLIYRRADLRDAAPNCLKTVRPTAAADGGKFSVDIVAIEAALRG